MSNKTIQKPVTITSESFAEFQIKVNDQNAMTPQEKGALYVACLVAQNSAQAAYKAWFPLWEKVTQKQISMCTLSKEEMATELVLMRRKLCVTNHPSKTLEFLLQTGPVAVSPETLSYRIKNEDETIEKSHGFFEKTPARAYAARVADRAFYMERRDETKSENSFKTVLQGMPQADYKHIGFPIKRDIQGDIYRQSIYVSLYKDPLFLCNIDNMTCSGFAPQFTVQNINAVKAGKPDLKSLLRYSPSTVTGVANADMHYMYTLILAHQEVRGSGSSNHSTPCAGYYAFSTTPSIAKLYGLVVDTMSIVAECRFKGAVIAQLGKKFNTPWALSLDSNKMLVCSRDVFSQRKTQDGLCPFNLLTTTYYVEFLPGDNMWSCPTNLANKNSKKKLYTTNPDDDADGKIRALLNDPVAKAVEVFLCLELQPYVQHLYPSSRGHLGKVWFINRPVRRFSSFADVVWRCTDMTNYMTNYPFSTKNYVEVDKFSPMYYRRTITLCTMRQKTKESKAMDDLFVRAGEPIRTLPSSEYLDVVNSVVRQTMPTQTTLHDEDKKSEEAATTYDEITKGLPDEAQEDENFDGNASNFFTEPVVEKEKKSISDLIAEKLAAKQSPTTAAEKKKPSDTWEDLDKKPKEEEFPELTPSGLNVPKKPRNQQTTSTTTKTTTPTAPATKPPVSQNEKRVPTKTMPEKSIYRQVDMSKNKVDAPEVKKPLGRGVPPKQ
jgi:hypothetical protein